MSAREWPMVGVCRGERVDEPPAPWSLAEEATLLSAARAGDRAAAECLLTPYERPLFRLCRGMLRQAEDAEDAVQETFFRALRALERFRGDAALRTWLYRIAMNVCREWTRSRPPIDPDAAPDRSLALAAPSPEEIVLRQLRILDALQTLTPRHRAILLLREVEGWSISEIAAALACGKKRVENELYRARCALAAWRRKEEEAGGTP